MSECRVYRPDHNGECLNCDEPLDAHMLDARDVPEVAGAYVCPRCHAVSFNPHDREQKYCARCHQFEEPW